MKSLFAVLTLALLVTSVTGARGDEPVPSFEQAVARLVEVSTSLQLQKVQVETSDIRRTQALFQFTPSVTVAAKTVRTGNSLAPSELSGKQAVGSADLNLFRFGADRAALNAAGKDREAQAALYENEFLSAELQAVSFLVDEISRKMTADIDRELVKLREQSLAIARARFAQGLLAQQEVEKVQVDLENSRARLADAEISRSEAEAALTARIGTARVAPVWPWQSSLLDRKARVFRVTDRETANHPAFRAATLALDSQESLLSAKNALFWPSIDAGFSYGFYNGAAVNAVPSQKIWSGAITLSFPLFNRLSNLSDIRLQSQAVIAADARREGVRIDLDQEKQSAKEGFDLALESVRRRIENLQISKRIYQDNLRRFRGGRINADELLIDQDRLLTSQLLEVNGWASVHRESTRYCHAMGYRLRDCL